MKSRKARYQQGSIKRVKRAKGYAWEVRLSEKVNGKRKQRCLTFDGNEYRTEKDVRKAIELTVSQINSGTASAKADSTFNEVTAIYRSDHLPGLQHSTQQLNAYLLSRFIEPRFSKVHIRDIKPLVISTWIRELELAPTTKASIRSVMSVCYDLAALHEFVPPMEKNPMTLIKIKGVSKRQKKIPQITVEDFQRLLRRLPELLKIMVFVDGCLGLRISELLALKWEDIDSTEKVISIQRKFTRGEIGPTKTEGSDAELPIAAPLMEVLDAWRPKTDGSEWVFPSPRTGGPRSASMLLQKGLKPVAKELGMGNVTWHTLRHACRSWLSSGGAAVGTQKDLLRQADIATTLNIYGHALTKDMRKAHERLVKQLALKD